MSSFPFILIRRFPRATINKKLIRFLNKEFKANVPDSYKLYEKASTLERGAYRFKFQIGQKKIAFAVIGSKFKNFSKDKLLKEVELLSEKYYKNPKNFWEKVIRFTMNLKPPWRFSITPFSILMPLLRKGK